MHQYEKLFDKSEVEYITPFLKLWMAFNGWYKKQQTRIKRDREAIDHYKATGEIKDGFLEMLASRSEPGSRLQEAVAAFVEISEDNEHQVSNVEWNRDSIYLHFSPSKKERTDNKLEFISETNKKYFILPEYKEDFFSDMLENIYQIRCCLVHGDFDIENPHFIDLVGRAYFILYPVMQKVIADQKSNLWFCKNNLGTDAKAILDKNGKMKVLTGSKIRIKTLNSYKNAENRRKILEEKGRLEEDVYVLKEHIPFPSYSAASSFCMGNSSNGWIDWKDKDGKTIDEVIRGK